MKAMGRLGAAALLCWLGGSGLAAGGRPGEEPPVTALAFAPDGKELVAGSQAGIEIRAWPDLGVLRRIETSLAHVHDIAFSPDGRWMAVAGGRPAESGGVELRAWPSGELLWTKAARDDLVYSVAWSPDSQSLYCAGHDARVFVRAAESGATVRVLEGHSRPVLAACVTPDGAMVVTAGVDQSLRAWDASTGECLRVLDNHTGTVRDLAMRPDADPDALAIVASVSDDGTVRLWQPTIGRLVRFARLPAAPLAVEWTPDGARLLVTAKNGRLYAIDPDTLEVASAPTAIAGWVYSLAVPPGGHAGDHGVAVAGENGQIGALRVPIPTGEDTR